MSVFAIRVYTGKEIEVKQKLKQVIEHHGQALVKAVHAFETFTQVFRGESSSPKHFKSAVPGYIFIELNVNFNRLPADLWYLIKSVPRVCQVFKDNIPEEEFTQFFQSVDTEPDIEVAFSQETVDKESMKAEVLHQANMASTPQERKEHLEEFEDRRKTKVDQVKALKQEAPGGLQKMMARCHAFIRRKKETFRFPFQLFHQTRNRMDLKQKLAVSIVTNGDLIIPELLTTLKREIQME